MGLVSTIIGLLDFSPILKVQRLTKGKRAKISVAQITNLNINLDEAARNLDSQTYGKIFDLFHQLRKDTFKYDVDIKGYYQLALDIVYQFDCIAPYEKYCGSDYEEVAPVLRIIRSKEYAALNAKQKQLTNREYALDSLRKTYKKNQEILDETPSEEEIDKMVNADKITSSYAEEWKQKIATVRFAQSTCAPLITAQEEAITTLQQEIDKLNSRIQGWYSWLD